MSNKALCSSMADMAGMDPSVCGQHFGEPPESLRCRTAGYFHQLLLTAFFCKTSASYSILRKNCKFTVIKFLHFSPFLLSLLVSNSSPHSSLTLPRICTLLLLDRKETHMHFLVETRGMSMVRTRSLCLTLKVRSVDRKRRDLP